MCGFVVTPAEEEADTRLLRLRGPDWHGDLIFGGFRFQHFLLHVTGGFLAQPFAEGDIVCVYNGEIYNQPFKISDGEVIVPMYRELGPSFARYLDGEFAIAIYDFGQRRAIFVTDAFGTKPLWVRGLRSASYGSCIGGSQVPPNSIIVRSFDGDESREPVVTFDFDNQHKDTFADWTVAFERAVAKRAVPACFIGLSAGYDSGSIAAALSKLSVDYVPYSVVGNEDLEILSQRIQLTGARFVSGEAADLEWCRAILKHDVEDFHYASVPNVRLWPEWMSDDPGAEGACLVYRHARAAGHFVALSGQGGDEIYSDYAYWPGVSHLRGQFPRQLSPWPNFFGGCQRAYLTKEEHVAGAFGIETRYPLLDRDLVQEFLWLTAELKNSVYKAPLHNYLKMRQFPFSPGSKTGFSSTRGCLT